jgi:hypothetical protein
MALGLGIDLADIGGKRSLFLFQPLDAFDQRFQLSCGETRFGHCCAPHPLPVVPP